LLFVPAARRLGATSATLIVFAFSGLVHEMLISVPAGGGYGGPLFYFLLQGSLVLAESCHPLRALLRQNRLYGRLWTAVVVIVPLPLLFHLPFQQRVVLPFLAAMGG
jgi:alginate O-acetyltransferase complex protein AlgI